MSGTIQLACAASPTYLRHAGAMLHSALAHTTLPVRVTLLHVEPLPSDDVEHLGAVLEAGGAGLQTVEIPASLMEGFSGTRNFPPVVWARVLLPSLLPDVDRVLYLDADVIVTDDLAPLWEVDLGDHLFGAVTNPCYPGLPPSKELGLARREDYLNSGVLLMDLARMRAEGWVDELRNFAVAHPDNPCPDQDALSARYHDRALRLHPRWNMQTICFERPPRRLPFPPGQIDEARARPAIVHFTGTAKPWHRQSRHPLAHRYFEHLDQTPWPRRPLQGGRLSARVLRPLPTPVQFVLAGPVARLRQVRRQLGARASVTRWRPRVRRRTAGTARAGLRLVFGPDSAVERLARDLYRWLTPRRPRPVVVHVLEAFAIEHPRAVFVQVGSNDAQRDDPLRRFVAEWPWRGVLTEPVPYVHERLRRHYGGHPRVAVEQVAVTDHDGTAEFHHLAPSDDPLPPWYDQLGSFSLDTILGHADEIPDIAERVRTIEVPCWTFETLCREHGLRRVDLVHVDAEGHDDVVLASIDLPEHRPTVLLYEHKHLDRERRDRARALVERHGFDVLEVGADTLCVSRAATRSPLSPLGRAWRIARRAHAAGAVSSYAATSAGTTRPAPGGRSGPAADR